MTTYFTTEENEKIAYSLCGRSKTKEALLDGRMRWSLADLRGKAKKYRGSYATQRDTLLHDLDDNGLWVVDIKLPSLHYKRVVII